MDLTPMTDLSNSSSNGDEIVIPERPNQTTVGLLQVQRDS